MNISIEYYCELYNNVYGAAFIILNVIDATLDFKLTYVENKQTCSDVLFYFKCITYLCVLL